MIFKTHIYSVPPVVIDRNHNLSSYITAVYISKLENRHRDVGQAYSAMYKLGSWNYFEQRFVKQNKY